MNGVDLADQYLSYYPLFRKSKKWTKKVVLYLFNCALFNSYRVYQTPNPTNKIKFNGFLLSVAKSWLEDKEDEEDISVPSTSTRTPLFEPIDRLSLDMKIHHPVKIVSEKTKKQVRRNCRVCTVHKIRKETAYMCKGCKVALHVDKCFKNYHTKKKY